MRHTSFTASALTVGLATALAGCGSDTLDPGGHTSASSPSSAKVTVTKDAALAKLAPADVRKQGTLVVGTNPSYAPNEFTVNGNQIKGMDIDLMTAIAQKLGLKIRFQSGNFDSLIGGVSSGKYALSISAFTINPERLQQISMVQYLNAGSQWAISKNSTKDINVAEPCGLTVGVQKGTVQVDELTAKNKACVAHGKPKVTMIVEESQAKVTADLVTGKVDAMSADSPVAGWAVTQNRDALKLHGKLYDSAPYGIAVAKDQTEFANAISKALTALRKDGTYQKILDNWGSGSGAVTAFPVNPSVEG